ncbi:MAG: TIGR00341 family protein [Bacteroidaceae bacterium]|nr:TIGR00341 family protein [Bacteroidaceae bacterium]
MKEIFDLLRAELRKYFNPLPDKEEETKTIENIKSGVSFRGAQLWTLVFAIFIASLGLNVNSPAVIIGAMLISPLMGPIIGMGLAVGIGDWTLLKTSGKNFLVATIISIITATVYFLISPFNEVQSELLARTSPTLYDVMIAFFGGAAGFMATGTRGKGNVIPGVAIATALMPPLCTAGFGLATGRWMYFLGAIYLFYINTIFISLSTFLGTRLLRFRRHKHLTPERARSVQKYFAVLVIVTMIPAAFVTVDLVRQSLFRRNVSNFIHNEWDITGTQILSHEANRDAHTLQLIAVGQEIPEDSIEVRRKRMGTYHLGDYQLQVIQGTQTDSLIRLGQRIDQMSSDKNKALRNQELRIIELENRLQELTNELDSLRPKEEER